MNSRAAPTVVGFTAATPGYGAVSRLNHWVIAVALIGMVSAGLFLEFGGRVLMPLSGMVSSVYAGHAIDGSGLSTLPTR